MNPELQYREKDNQAIETLKGIIEIQKIPDIENIIKSIIA